MRSRFSSRYEFDEHKWRCDGITTRLYKAVKCVINQGGARWHLSQITDEIEPSERGRHVLGARRKSERETRKLRCAKPSAPKPSRRRMKPTLNWTKSKAEAYAPGHFALTARVAGLSCGTAACWKRVSPRRLPASASHARQQSLVRSAHPQTLMRRDGRQLFAC